MREAALPPNQGVFKKWWPTTQSLDLVEGTIEQVATAAKSEFSKIAEYVGDDDFVAEWQRFESLDEAFSSVPYFDNVASRILLLPTHSKWVVMWNNAFLCDGFDRFCMDMTRHHALTTIHWSAHDDWTTYQSGAMFHHRRKSADGLVERRVQAAQADRKWGFFEEGEALPEEDLDGYRARRKRDRLNERRVIELLSRLGAAPWEESFYALPGQKVFSLARQLPQRAERRRREEVLLAKR